MFRRDTSSHDAVRARGARLHPLLSSVALLLGIAFLLPSNALAQGAPVGCGYGAGGPNASNLCWLDMAGYSDVQARSLAGQPMSVTLPGGYTASFTVTSRSTGVGQYPAVEAREVPLEPRFAFGTVGYVGVPGRPSLYSLDAGANNGVALTLSNISVVDSAGAPVTGYSFVIADTENNIVGESFTWTSDKPLEQIGVLRPFDPPRGCNGGLTGLGTTTVSCTGQGSNLPPPGTAMPWYDNVIVGADTPSTIGLTLRTFARSGVAFAIMTSTIEVTKAVVGRVRTSDSFDVSATSPEGSTIESESTGSASSATTGQLTVLPRTTGAPYTLAEVATPGSGTLLSDYSRSWSCTNNGVADPSLPSGSATSVAVSPAPGDDIECTITNTQLPADVSIVKTAPSSPVVPGEDATFTMVVTNHGPSRATNVSVSDQLPAAFAFASASPGCAEAGGALTCAVGDMAVGASRTLTVTGAVAGSLDHCLENSATVSSVTPDSTPGNSRSTVCAPIEGRSNLSIAKESSTTTVPLGGGQVMYTLVVRNDGPSDATGTTVTDALPAGLALASADASQGSCSTADNTVSCDLGLLRDGGSAQVLVTANTTGASGCITNTARVLGAHVDPDPDDNRASAEVCVPPTPIAPQATLDLDVDKRTSARRVRIGQRVRYTVVVTNRGQGAAADAKLTDTFNRRATVVSAKPTAGTCSRRMPLRCSLGTIDPGASVTIRVVIKPRESGRARNAASATGNGTDATPADNLDAVDVNVRKVELRLSKVAARSSVRAGEPLSYRIRVRNPTKGEARNLRVCDRLPTGLRYVRSQPRARVAGSRRCWRIKRLGARRSRTFRITVRTARGANGRRTNRATVSSPDITRRVRARDVIRVRGVPTPVTG